VQDGGGPMLEGQLARSCARCGCGLIETIPEVATIIVSLAERSGAGGAADHA